MTSAFYLFLVTSKDFLSSKFKNISKNLAHFSFSMLILSILFNNIFSTEIITNLKIGETFEGKEFKIIFESVDQKNEQNYNSFTGNFKIEDHNGVIDFLKPELRIYNQPNIVTSEADIKTTLFTDKFIGIPIFCSIKNNHISFEHSHPPHSFVMSNDKFKVISELKKEINEFIN